MEMYQLQEKYLIACVYIIYTEAKCDREEWTPTKVVDNFASEVFDSLPYNFGGEVYFWKKLT